MTASSRRTFTLSINPRFFNSAKTKIRQGLALSTTLLLAVSTFAQQTAPAPPPAAMGNPITVSVPAGTRIALVLTQPVQTRYLHRGDDVYAQITSPVASGTEVVIPPGTFVQGKFDKLERRGDRGELRLQSMAITFPNGYVAPVPGPMTLESDEGYALKDPGKGRIAGMIALPAAGLFRHLKHVWSQSELPSPNFHCPRHSATGYGHRWWSRPGRRRHRLTLPVLQFAQLLSRPGLARADGLAATAHRGCRPGRRHHPEIQLEIK